MRVFDAQLAIAARSDEDLANLAYFDTAAALLVADTTQRAEDAASLTAVFEGLVQGVQRARSFRIAAGAAIGIHPDMAPERAHDAAWDTLDALATDSRVWAIGVLARDGTQAADRLCHAHLALAASSARPVFADITGPEARRDVEWFVSAAAEHGIHASRVVVRGVDYTTLRLVLRSGAHPLLAVGPAGASPSETAELLVRFGDQTLRRALLTSAARGTAMDVLALPRVGRALVAAGVSQNDVRRVLFENAARIVGAERIGPRSDQASK